MLHNFETLNMANPAMDELKTVNQKTQFIVFGFVRNAQNLLLEPTVPSPLPVTSDAMISDDEDTVDPESSNGSNHDDHDNENDSNENDSSCDGHDDTENNQKFANEDPTADTLDANPDKLPDDDRGESSLWVSEEVNAGHPRTDTMYTVSITADHGHESSSSSCTSFTKIPDGVSYIVVSYYHDKLLLQTNFLYSSWSDLGRICSEQQLSNIKQYRRELVQMGYNPNKLPLYELYRYYFGVAQDMNRALNKWKGSVETFTYYNLQSVPIEESKRCFRLLTKSCTFCGYHDMDIGRPSPVFVLNYANFDWDDFDDINAVIKTAFYGMSVVLENMKMSHMMTCSIYLERDSGNLCRMICTGFAKGFGKSWSFRFHFASD